MPDGLASRLVVPTAILHSITIPRASSKTDLNLRSACDNSGRFYGPHVRKKKKKRKITPLNRWWEKQEPAASPPRSRSPFANFLHMAYSFLRFSNDISQNFYRELYASCFIYQTWDENQRITFNIRWWDRKAMYLYIYLLSQNDVFINFIFQGAKAIFSSKLLLESTESRCDSDDELFYLTAVKVISK